MCSKERIAVDNQAAPLSDELNSDLLVLDVAPPLENTRVFGLDECKVETLTPLSLSFNPILHIFICLHCYEAIKSSSLLSHLRNSANLRTKKKDFEGIVNSFPAESTPMSYKAISVDVQAMISGVKVFLNGASCRLCLFYATTAGSLKNHVSTAHSGSVFSLSHDIIPLQRLFGVLFKVSLPIDAVQAQVNGSGLHSSLFNALQETISAIPAHDEEAKIQSSFFLNSKFVGIVQDFSAENVLQACTYDSDPVFFETVRNCVGRLFNFYKDVVENMVYLSRLLNTESRFVFCFLS